MENTDELELEDIFGATLRDKDSLFEWMLNQPRVKRILDEVAARVATQFKQEKDEIRAAIVRKLYKSLESIVNPRALDDWCDTVARNYCRDVCKKTKMIVPFVDEISLGDSEDRKRNGKPLLQNWDAMTVEKELQMKGALSKAIKPFPREWVQAFAEGKNSREIGAEFGVSLATAHRRLKEMQKAIIEALKEALELPLESDQLDSRMIAEIAMEFLQSFLPKMWATDFA